MPELGIYQSNEPNAFATWASKNSSIVAVSTWLLDIMDEWAIQWVVAHEMAHILNWDMVTMTLLQWILNTFVVFFARIVANFIASRSDEGLSWIAYMWVYILLEIIFWLLATPIAMAFSRHREYRADAWSAHFVWKEKMIAWLEALKRMQTMAPSDGDNLATMKISTKWKGWLLSLYSSHPDLDDRIKALEELKI
jgi:heat shock protein HtpX